MENKQQMKEMQLSKPVDRGINIQIDSEVCVLWKSTLKIRNYKHEHYLEMGHRLDSICKGLGLSLPENSTMSVIMEFLRDEFKDFSMNEVILALNKNSANKLGKEQIIPIGFKFSTMFLGGVLNAYREYRQKQVKLSEQIEERKRKETDWNRKYPDSEYYESFLKFITENKKVPQSWDYKAIFNHLEAIGEIKMSNEEKKKWKESVILELEKEAREEAEKGQVSVKSVLGNMTSEENLKFECRKRLVIRLIKEKYLNPNL